LGKQGFNSGIKSLMPESAHKSPVWWFHPLQGHESDALVCATANALQLLNFSPLKPLRFSFNGAARRHFFDSHPNPMIGCVDQSRPRCKFLMSFLHPLINNLRSFYTNFHSMHTIQRRRMV